MSYKILCWKYPQTDFSRNSQGADSLFITPNYPFTVSLTFLITDSLMIVLFLPTTDAEIHWSGLKLNPWVKLGAQNEVFFPLKLKHAWKSPGRLVKIRLLGLTPRVSDSVGLGWGREFAFQPSSLVMLLLQFPGPHVEPHWFGQQKTWTKYLSNCKGMALFTVSFQYKTSCFHASILYHVLSNLHQEDWMLPRSK